MLVHLINPLVQAANAAVAPQGGHCIWKTTTYGLFGRVTRERDELALRHAAINKWQVMDAWLLTQLALKLSPRPWVDPLHFYGYVYEALNQFLLNMICP